MGIGGIRLPKLGTHPLLFHAELRPEHQEYQEQNDDPAYLGERNRGSKEPDQNAGVDGMPDQGIGGRW